MASKSKKVAAQVAVSISDMKSAQFEVWLRAVERVRQTAKRPPNKNAANRFDEVARALLRWCAQALTASEPLPENAREWLAEALHSIADGGDANTALGLALGKGVAIDPQRTRRICYVELLRRVGLQKQDAVEIVTDNWGGDADTLAKAHRDLANRRGAFAGVKGVWLEVGLKRFEGTTPEITAQSGRVNLCLSWYGELRSYSVSSAFIVKAQRQAKKLKQARTRQ
jgi:hypothetical protein